MKINPALDLNRRLFKCPPSSTTLWNCHQIAVEGRTTSAKESPKCRTKHRTKMKRRAKRTKKNYNNSDKKKKRKKKKKLPGAADETRPILAVQLGVATLMKRRFNPLLCLWPLLSCSVFLCFFKRPERVQQCPRSEWMTKTKEPKEGQREKRDANIRRLLTHKHTHTKK